MGRQLFPPVRRHVVSGNDDERELDRRHFLKCMAWVGTGAVWAMSGGILRGAPLGQLPDADDGARRQRTPLRPDQRQSHRLRQAGEHRRDRDASCGHREDQGRTGSAGVRAAHRRPHTPLQADRVRHRTAGALRAGASGLLRPRRARCARGRREELPGAIREGDSRRRLAQLRPRRRALHRSRQRRESQGGRAWHAGRRAARVAGERREAADEQHADRRVRSHAACGRSIRTGDGAPTTANVRSRT